MTKESFILKWLPKDNAEYKQLMLNDLNRIVAEESIQELSQKFLQPEVEILAEELEHIRSPKFSNKTKILHAEFLLQKYFMFTKIGDHLFMPTV